MFTPPPPLNKINYEKYIQTDDIIEKYQILENVLVGNILSFAKGMGIYFNNKIKVTILQVDEPKVYRFKNIKMMGFDIRFKSNVSLPDYIGLGKGVSIGFGMIKRL
ncbi:CRISPR-associated endonuclease Cas6 [Xylanibacter rarus]|uniref:CRISPR-associated endonuclease Cas6 n=1 Tax=Xylanibacter rarus TaxID=1676614 RepID=UPI0035223C6F